MPCPIVYPIVNGYSPSGTRPPRTSWRFRVVETFRMELEAQTAARDATGPPVSLYCCTRRKPHRTEREIVWRGAAGGGVRLLQPPPRKEFLVRVCLVLLALVGDFIVDACAYLYGVWSGVAWHSAVRQFLRSEKRATLPQRSSDGFGPSTKSWPDIESNPFGKCLAPLSITLSDPALLPFHKQVLISCPQLLRWF